MTAEVEGVASVMNIDGSGGLQVGKVTGNFRPNPAENLRVVIASTIQHGDTGHGRAICPPFFVKDAGGSSFIATKVRSLLAFMSNREVEQPSFGSLQSLW